MKIAIIAALDQNQLIGKQNKLPWHLPRDLQYFKKITMNKPVIMGRKTYESIGRLLPGRENIIITRNKDYHVPGAKIFYSLESACKNLENFNEIMIIGGTQIFASALPLAHRLYLTYIHGEFEGDCYFPSINHSHWQKTEQRFCEADEKNPYDCDFVVLDRINVKPKFSS